MLRSGSCLQHRCDSGKGVSFEAVMPPPTLCRVDGLEAHVSFYSSVHPVSMRGIIIDSPERRVRDQLDDNAWVSPCFSSLEPEPSLSLPYQRGGRSE
jgi:hypothetical protein